MAASTRLNLGELIDRLSLIQPDHDGEPKLVRYVMPYLYPTTLASFRGYYEDLALGIDGSIDYCSSGQPPTVDVLLRELRESLGKSFTGWKGGRYLADRNSGLWVANPGNAGDAVITGITDRGYYVTLDIAHDEDCG